MIALAGENHCGTENMMSKMIKTESTEPVYLVVDTGIFLHHPMCILTITFVKCLVKQA